MKNGFHAGQSVSLWMKEKAADTAPLQADGEADVCVVGAGITGLSVAYHLGKEGKSVIVLDDGPVGGGETERTSAHLASALDERFAVLEKYFGPEKTHLAADSHKVAIDRIEKIVADEKIDCDFRRVDGWLFNGSEQSAAFLGQEAEAARRAGMDATLQERTPWPDFHTGPAIRFAAQGQFHPTKYLNGLVAAIKRQGGHIYGGTHAQEMVGGDEAFVETKEGHTIRTRAVVVATNSPVNDRWIMHPKQAPYRTYVIGAVIPKGYVPSALYWDTEDPYHYVRVQEEGDRDIVIVGGEDHRTGDDDRGAAQRYDNLETWTRERFPKMQQVAYRWSGQVEEPMDGLAFIGRNPLDKPNVYISTGDSGHGLTHGTIAGMLITDLIMGRQNPWAELYDPARKTLRALPKFAKENWDTAVYYGDHLLGGDVESPDQVKTGSGAIIRKGTTKIALYRDDQGSLHTFSAVCPHAYGVVRWNDTEKSFDCPCHGSRFRPDGTVVNGPSLGNLQPASLD